MKFIQTVSPIILLTSTAFAAECDHAGCNCSTPYAPAGIMGDHVHKKGEWMTSYRHMYMSMGGHQDGTTSLSTGEVHNKGFMTAATSMEMHMDMFGLMYAPTDKVTLMGMLNYVQKDMKLHNAMMMGGGMHGSHPTSHSSEGIGDTSVSALVQLYADTHQSLHFTLGVVLPTAEVDIKQDGAFLPYGMQLGGGTWDGLLGLTYQKHFASFTWGTQANSRTVLEEDNESGFAFGDAYSLNSWISAPVSKSLQLTSRVSYSYQEDIQGHFHGSHHHSAPQNFQANYGGHILELGLGCHYLLPKGHRLSAEILTPIYQDANGIGMDREVTCNIGWIKTF